MPLISVVLSCCDVEPWLREAADSFLSQSFGDFDLTFYVEASRDSTEEVARSIASDDNRCRVVTGLRTGSASASRNWGMDQATGEYVWFFDGDDLAPQESLARLAGLLRTERPDILMGQRLTRVDAGDGNLRPGGVDTPAGAPGIWPSGLEYIRGTNLFRRPFATALTHCLFRRQALLRLGFAVPHGRRHQDDGWLYRLLLESGKVLATEEPVCIWRRRAGSVTTAPNPQSALDRMANCRDALLWADELPGDDPKLKELGVYFRHKLFHAHPLGLAYDGGRYRPAFAPGICRKCWRELFASEAARRGLAKLERGASAGQKVELALMRLAQVPGCFRLARTVLRALLRANAARARKRQRRG